MNIYLYRDDQNLGPYPVENIREMLANGQVLATEAALEEGTQEWRTVGHFTGASEPLIHIIQDGEQLGPYTLEQLNAELAQGCVQTTAHGYFEGMANWALLPEIPGVVIPVVSSPVPVTTKPVPTVKESTEQPGKIAKPNKDSSRTLVIAGSVVGVAIVAGLIWFFLFRGPASKFDPGNLDHRVIETAIREAIAKPEGALTEDDYLKVKKLVLMEKRLKDISTLSKLAALEELNLTGNELLNIEPLSALKMLKTLNLSANKLNDLKHLEALRKMETLDVSGNQISDASPLIGLSRIKDLNLSKNIITDVGPLGKLTMLEYLDIESNQVVNLAPLADLTILKTLNLQGNDVKDITAISKLTILKMLMVGKNPVTKESVENLRKEMKNCVIN